MHERSPKNTPIDTLRYEIDMLRHCFQTLQQKHRDMLISSSQRAEYHLGLEGFLLHLRNLLGFFTNHSQEDTDLIINKPARWAQREIHPREYSDLIKRAKGVDRQFGKHGRSCYDQISKFLQHCTTLRHEEPRSWNVEGMFQELDPVLQDFEKRFGNMEWPAPRKPAPHSG